MSALSALLPADISWPLLGAVLSASLLGSIHCAGMCGPFVAVYSAAEPALGRGSRSRWVPHVAYHGGRGLTYTTLGGLAGAAGAAVDWAGQAAGVAHIAALVSGVLVILWGVSVLVPRLRIESPVARFFAPQLAKLGTRPRVFRASLLGVFTPLLPCGWLYAFVLAAAGTGTAWGGVLLMFSFWLGTVPALLGVGTVLARVGDTLRNRVPVLTGIALILIGSLGVVSRLAHPLSRVAQPQVMGTPQVPGEGAKCH